MNLGPNDGGKYTTKRNKNIIHSIKIRDNKQPMSTSSGCEGDICYDLFQRPTCALKSLLLLSSG